MFKTLFQKVYFLYKDASKSKLLKNLAGAFVAGTVGSLVSGGNLKVAAGTGAGAAGIALVNFIQKPTHESAGLDSGQ